MSVSYGGDKITFDDGSSLSTGYTHFRNRVINGAMEIDQRNAGASVTANDGTFAVDRTYFNMSTNSKGTGIQSTDAPPGFKNSLLYTNGSAYTVTSNETYGIIQNIEGTNISDLAWGTASAKTVTLSFWVKSSVTGTHGGVVKTTGSSPAYSYAFTYTISSANTWEYKTITIPGPTVGTWVTTNATGIRLGIGLGNGSNNSIAPGSWTAANVWSATGAVSVLATANATWAITGLQLEVGSYATTFERKPYTTELQLCQRYYYKLAPVGSGLELIPGLNPGTTSNLVKVPLPVSMRIKPSIEISSAGWGFVRNRGSFTAYTTTGVSSRDGSQPAFAYFDATVASGLTSAEIGYTAINDGSWLAFSAEL